MMTGDVQQSSTVTCCMTWKRFLKYDGGCLAPRAVHFVLFLLQMLILIF
jgi:hypothetical protein